MEHVDDIFEKFGGTMAFARAIEIKPSAASEMRRRKSIPVRYWPRLIGVAFEKDIVLTNDMLVNMHVLNEQAKGAA
ncbi:carph-isopro domain-containing protein [Brucella intermedia]|uniref:carph-isopro domain-containing protein n=1 Tax=Brucella/Ochrobactrum group TaxID=2826938 RepID=UPI003B6362DB